MKRFSLAAACVIWASALAAGAVAQPILNRVEGFLRDQVDAASKSAQPAEPGYLGLIVDDAGDGVRVQEIVPGHAAEQAGLKTGDRITAIGGQPVRAMDDMARALADKPVGTKLAITAQRDGAQRQFDVTLGRRGPEAAAGRQPQPAAEPVAKPRPRLGVRTVPVSAGVQRQNNLPNTRGAQIISVVVGSPAERAQIPLGAVVTAVGETAIGTPRELAAAISAVKTNDVEVSYVYHGQTERKKVAVREPVAAATSPQREVRGRLPLPEPPGPADDAPPKAAEPAASKPEARASEASESESSDSEARESEAPPQKPSEPPADRPPPDPQSRLEALERHVKQLEERIKTLEAELARHNKPEADEPN